MRHLHFESYHKIFDELFSKKTMKQAKKYDYMPRQEEKNLICGCFTRCGGGNRGGGVGCFASGFIFLNALTGRFGTGIAGGRP